MMMDLRAFVVLNGLVTVTVIVVAMTLISRYPDNRRGLIIQETVRQYQQKFDERFESRLKRHLSENSERRP